MHETPVYVPSHAGMLSGILTTPDGDPGDTAVLFLAGSHIARSNKNGMWTRAAREIAGLGLLTLRLDLEGAGDSEGPPSKTPITRISPEPALAGVRFIRDRLGIRRVLIAGSCYGGRQAMIAAAEDPEVVSIFPVAVPVMERGKRPPVQLFIRRVQRKLHLHRGDPGRRVARLFEEPLAKYLAREGATAHFLYGDHDPFLEEYRRAMAHLGPKLGAERAARAELEVIPGHEFHAFRTIEGQDAVIDATVRWASSFLPVGAGASG